MSFFIAGSPHMHNRRTTSSLMRWVAICALPGLIVQCYFFGWGTLIQLAFAIALALALEAGVMLARGRAPRQALRDNSALVSAWLLAVAVPPLAPWWIMAIGLIFAIVIAKHLYGGLGQNLFNPAMVAYVVLLIAFPVPMTSWSAPDSIAAHSVSFSQALSLIFTGFDPQGLSLLQIRSDLDGITMATPLDGMKTALKAGTSVTESMTMPIFNAFAGQGWMWVNFAYLVGGLILLQQRVIQWMIPVAFLLALTLLSTISWLVSPDNSPTPWFHLLSGATMLGAFFIATDPVSASTTVKGRLIFGAMIGALVYIIRTWGGFPDGVAFAVLIANMCVPLIDYYTKPRTYGH